MEEKTLRDLLNEDGFKSSSDRTVKIHNHNMDMLVSHRYLSGGWNEILDSFAIRNMCGEYTIIDNE